MPKRNKWDQPKTLKHLFFSVSLLALPAFSSNSVALATTPESYFQRSLPSKKTNLAAQPMAKPFSALRGKAELELSLAPLQSRMKARSSQGSPLQVENLPTPVSLIKPTFTEAAVTLSTLTPSGTSKILGTQKFDLSQVESLPVLCAQIQHWLSKDYERQQNFGFILGTGLGEKQITVDFSNGYTLSNVDILYMKLLAGLSWEQTLIEDRLTLGFSGLFTEELWQQNTTSLESRWSQWTPAFNVLAQGKLKLNQRWYSLLEIHNQWPLRDNLVETSTQRLHLGLGYYL